LLDSSSLEDDSDSESLTSPQGKQEDESIIAAFTALAVDDDDDEEGDESKGTPRRVDLAEGRRQSQGKLNSLPEGSECRLSK
jgi:hypothetical protein